jgi:shikimate dehydrogenase
VVILGAGGAARAAAFALREAGAEIVILARDATRAAALAASVGAAAHGDLESLALHPFDILINATPLGSGAAPDQTPVHPSLHRTGTVVFDMVYEPRLTPLLRDAEAAGCVIIDGLQMLVAQGAAQFEAWTGTKAPVDEMLQAALDLSGKKVA